MERSVFAYLSRWGSFCLIFFGICGLSHAALVVSYGGDYVTADRTFNSANTAATPPWSIESAHGIDFDGDGDQLDRVLFRQLDLTTPWSTSMGPNYTGPAFFGGFTAFEQTVSTNGTTDAFILQNNGTADEIRAVVRNALGHLVFLFPTSEPVDFGNGDSISFTVGQQTNATGRLVAQSNGLFYLSQTNVAAANTIDPSAIQWSLYDLSVGSKDLIPGSLTFNVPGTSLDNVTHVGLYVSAGDSSGSVLELQNLQVNATPVPEPSVLMACSLLAIGIVGRSLQRRLIQGNL